MWKSADFSWKLAEESKSGFIVTPSLSYHDRELTFLFLNDILSGESYRGGLHMKLELNDFEVDVLKKVLVYCVTNVHLANPDPLTLMPRDVERLNRLYKKFLDEQKKVR